MKRFALITMLLVVTPGCASTYAMKISRTRAVTDLAVTQLIEYKVLTPDDTVLIVAQLREALGSLDKVSDYTAAVHASLVPYVGGKVLAHLLLKTLPKYAFKLESYRFGLEQSLNQAEVAALNYPKKDPKLQE